MEHTEFESEVRERLARLEQDETSVHRRLDSLEQLTESIHIIAMETKAMRADIKVVRDDMGSITERVDEIEKRPVRWYDTAVTAVITAVIGILIGYFSK